jgi:hypothetical protein
MSTVIAGGSVRRLPEVAQRKSSRLILAWLFVVGASVVLDISVMGRLMGPDILCSIGLIVLLLTRGLRDVGKEAKLFFLLIGLWLFGAVITDLIRGTALEDIARGWSKIAFFTVTFAYVYLATEGKLFNIISFLLGLNAGALATLLIAPDEFYFEEPWKFGYGPPITVLMLVCISTPFFRRIVGPWGQIVSVVALAVLNLVGNARSVFAILFAVACIVALGEFFRLFLRGRPVPKLLFLFTLLGGVVVYQGVVTVYEMAASSGILGDEALEKYQSQTEGDVGILLSGRPEVLASTQAIADSPIIGHGSWAKDYTYVELYLEALDKRGVPIVGDPYSDGLIPSHSYLFGSWVEAGIFGGIFWIYVMVICGRSLYSLLHIPYWSRPLVAFIVFSLMWDVLFSPFGAQERFTVPAEFCIVLWAIRNERAKTPLRLSSAGELA